MKQSVSFVPQDSVSVEFCKLTDNALYPQSDNETIKLFAIYDDVINPMSHKLIKTDIAMKLPPNYYGQIILPQDKTVLYIIGAGVIDSDYRGNIGVIIFNNTLEKLKINRHDNIANMVIKQIRYVSESVFDFKQSTSTFPCDGNAIFDYKFPKSILPCKCSVEAAGYDIFSNIDTILKARTMLKIELNFAIHMEMLEENEIKFRIAPRSGLALKNGIHIDHKEGNDYFIIMNHSDTDFQINKKDRIAQLIFEYIKKPHYVLNYVSSLTSSERNENGFGSTGK